MKRNQSVQKAIAILRAAATGGAGETASNLAREANLPWATALRLIHTLEEERFLRRLPETDRLAIGPDLMRIARQADSGSLVLVMALPHLERLAGKVEEAITLGIVRLDGAIDIVHQIDGPHLIGQVSWLGRTYPLHASSSGKMLLSTFDEARLDEFLRVPLQRYARATITDPNALRLELDRVRRDGFSTIVDELEEGLASVSVGICDGSQLVAVLNVSGPTFRFDAGARAAAVPLLQQAAAAIERDLAGHTSDQ